MQANNASQPSMGFVYGASNSSSSSYYVSYNASGLLEPNPHVNTPVTSFVQANSSTRQQRNIAEKMRRDKINSFITELSCIVPMIAKSPKRMDKTSILRLTATHLRIYQTLVNSGCEKMDLPTDIDQNMLEDLVCECLGGYLMILSGSGKIIFVSPTVERVLGHLQTDIMGQSIYSFMSPEDEPRFKAYLATTRDEEHARKYFTMRLKRAGPRSESPVYEVIEVTGAKQVTRPRLPNLNMTEEHSRELHALTNDMWVFFMRLTRPEPYINLLMEANKDEYVTRHLIDGKIVNCDQRISFVAGYMIEEVSGLTAFKFMHKDDVRWVMIALRQMYDKGEARGSSCYRLMCRTGQFIFLRTFGFLENDDSGIVKSFICVNKLVTEKEGMELINDMKQRYSALIKNTTPMPLLFDENTNPFSGSVEDPEKLDAAITHLISDLPSPESDVQDCPSTPSIGSLSPCDTGSSTSGSSHRNAYPPYFTMNSSKKRSTSETTVAQKRVKQETLSPISSPLNTNHQQQQQNHQRQHQTQERCNHSTEHR